MARLTIIGPEGRQESELQPHNTVGRHPSNTIQILDRIVSKEHCHIDRVDDGWVLRDLGSLNGTYVNGERVSEQPLRHGDEVTLGTTRLVFHLDDAPGSQRHASKPATTTQPEVQPPGGLKHSKVTMSPGMVESQIRTKLAPLIDQSFLPERLITEGDVLRRDYEKLRVSYEVIRGIGAELNVDKLLAKIIESAFQLLPADRGVILLYDESQELKPRCVRTKKGEASNEEVVLSTTIINEVVRDRAAVLSNDATVDSRFNQAHSIIMQSIRSTMAVPLLHSSELYGVMVLDSQIATGAFTEKDLQLFQNIANQAAIAIQNSLYARKLEQEAVTRERFQRLLSPQIAEQVIAGEVEIQKGGQLRDTTVLFSDIRGFTTMSESQDPQVIVDMLNDYFERMVDVVFKHEGTLDKFVGDEIMALFGSPVAHADDPIRAVRTALEMQEVLHDFNAERVARGEEPVRVGIGINSGPVIAGYIGSSKSLEYTAIGDTVNTGARLCSMALPGQILITEHTYARVREHFEAVEQPERPVKGKKAPVKTYLVIREVGAGVAPEVAEAPSPASGVTSSAQGGGDDDEEEEDTGSAPAPPDDRSPTVDPDQPATAPLGAREDADEPG
ncbi:MAG TPA: adenylate/guanylate cyclase domain-containing protein [Polyangiaceae bacterium LLY-WYZ-14_1]|nr:adenylate/guanylate cyclase domain-containing protein [Polyangiaceae bacterium LLY-WYZ-14_1]